MNGFVSYILTALAFVFVIEGLLYALFPDSMRRLMALALAMPLRTLRFLGFTMAMAGLAVAWLLNLPLDH